MSAWASANLQNCRFRMAPDCAIFAKTCELHRHCWALLTTIFLQRRMDADFYIDSRGLASYFEKDWFDHVIAHGNVPSTLFDFPAFDLLRLYCDSHERIADI